jgi:aspartyl-tRNA synthetase
MAKQVKAEKVEKTEKAEGFDLGKFSKNRTYIKDVFSGSKKQVELAGWVSNSRALGKIKFIMLRDISGTVQITGVASMISPEIFEMMDKIPRESAIYIRGVVQDAKQAPGGKEIIPDMIHVFAKAEDPVIDVSDYSKTELPKRLDYRFLDLHRTKIQAIFKVQSTILQAYHEFMTREDATECIFPSVISSSSEGGTELFEAKYFEKKAFLSQSCQLYKQMLACSMEKIFAVFTVWRAEKHNTIRHLNEARQFDFEMAFADEFVVMDIMARCVQYIVKKVMDVNKEELKELGVTLKVPAVKFLKFSEVAEVMKKNNIHMGKDDLSGEAEKKLDELYPETIVFVHDWPLSGKPFYIMPKGKDLSCGFDAIYKGMEITSGGQRIHLPELLIERLKAKGLNPKDFEHYIDSFRYGAPPHAGWGIGLERLTMLILNLPNIREAVLFPRDRDRLTP